MRRAYNFRLFTNANQERELGIMLESHRRLYNDVLSLRETAWQFYGETFSYADSSEWFTEQREDNPYFARLNFSSAQQTLRRLDKAFQNFFRRCQEGAEKPGYPRYKGRNQFNSIDFTYRDGISLLPSGKLRVQHVGEIRVKLHREIQGKIKRVSLKQEAGKWYVVFVCDLGHVHIPPSINPPVGVDVGLESFLTTSDGDKEPNPRFHKKELPEIRRKARAVTRKKRGGKNRRKAARRLQKVHTRIRNLRREHRYQVANRLVRRYGLIAVERLDIQEMLRSGRLARSISDAGWYGFTCVLASVAERAGARVVEVDPRGTTQECSQCGQVVPKTLWVRRHDCPHCGLSVDRDWNAARNILHRGTAPGLGQRKRNVGQ